MKRVLGLDLGTNSIGWALIEHDFDKKVGRIEALGSRIIPMDQGVLGKFDAGQSHSQTAERTNIRSVRRLYQRANLRRERLHRVLNILGFLPNHYRQSIDFVNKLGQFKKEVKLDYRLNNGKYEFIFEESFNEMLKLFKKRGVKDRIPYDWTIYYLRKKALYEKISKEELSWILLNFNQKRGYYQLRDETNDETKEKNKTYEVLQVSKVVDTGEINGKNEKLYKIFFENGWEYDKNTTKPDNWIGKTKEFIVTTKVLNSGEVKRTYKSVNEEEDWDVIKAKTQQEIDKSGKHIGEYIFDSLLLNVHQKIRGKLIKTIERKYYRNELIQILKTQMRFHDELQNKKLYKTCINDLYKRNEAHKKNIIEKGFDYLFIDDIIFYQRPLKSKKSTVSGCRYEKRGYWGINNDTGLKEFKTDALKSIAKSHPLYQEFRIWQFMKNLKVYQREKYVEGKLKIDVDVTHEIYKDESSKVALFEYLYNRGEVSQKNIIDFLVKNRLIEKEDKNNYRWNNHEDKKYPMNTTRASFVSRIKKVNNVDVEKLLNKANEQHLWHIIYSVKDATEYKKALEKFALKHGVDKDSFLKAFINYPVFKNEYGTFSEKAIKKLLPLMRMGKYWNEDDIHIETKDRIQKIIDGEFDDGIRNRVRQLVEEQQNNFNSIKDFKDLPLWLASYIVYDRYSEATDNKKWNSPDEIDVFLRLFKQHSLRNPIVEQVILETMRTVRDIWKVYGDGKKDFFDEIHIELGREMKNSAKKRKRLSNENLEREKTNNRIRLLLKELINDGAKPNSPSHQEILKIYEGAVYNNPKVDYKIISEEDIRSIRKSNSPTISQIKKYKLWLEQGYISPYTGKTIPLNLLFTKDYQIEHIIPQSRYFDNSMNNKVICESAVNQLKDNLTAYEFIEKFGGSIVELGNGHNVKIFNIKAYEAHCKQYFVKNKIKLKNLLIDEIPEAFINRQMNDTRYISKYIKNLLTRIVKQENEHEAISKNIVVLAGSITSVLKHDWGLNDKWNKLILPRFQRLNKYNNSQEFTYVNESGVEVPTVPDNLSKGFSKKRIDHRHHALDALVIALCTKDHINYITSLNTQRNNFSLVSKLKITEKIIKKDDVTGKIVKKRIAKSFHLPWKNLPVEAFDKLQNIVISFKKNTRVINKTQNKYWKYIKQQNGKYKKQLVLQKGTNWSIRKPLHKETISGKIQKNTVKGKIATAVRNELTSINNMKHIEKISDISIRRICYNHIKNYIDVNGKVDYSSAFSKEGVDDLNKNIIALNNGKFHHPIYRIRQYEIGNKFPVSENENSPKNKKYVETAKGTNLFFAVYEDENNKRNFETVPFNVVVEHQKQAAYLPNNKKMPIPVNHEKGKLLFTLSPYDLVFVPSDEELENMKSLDILNLSKEQRNRIFVVNDFSGVTCYFTPNRFASHIVIKEVDLRINIKTNKLIGSFDNKTANYNGKAIKDICVKLKTNRLGQILGVEY